jgi:arylsulfatase A-like enzyme
MLRHSIDATKPYCRCFMALACLLAACVLSSPDCVGAEDTLAPQKTPHIVVLLADDLGYNDVGFNGSREIQTPELDKLARDAVVLKSMYVQPICSPTRAAFLSGRYPMRYGLQTGIISPSDEFGLDLKELTIAQELGSLGYRTAICGKWHVGWVTRDYWPMARGFDLQYGMIKAGYIDYFQHTRPGTGRDWYRQEKPLQEEGYSTDLIANEAVRVITKHDGKAPLFLYVAFNAPHGPFQPPKNAATAAYNDLPEKRKPFAEMVTSMDRGIGRIAKALAERGMLDDTLMVFSSDNGGVAPGTRADNTPLRAGKGTVYEGGVRACAFARWPKVFPAGVNRHPMHVTDWYPTFVEAAGGAPKKDNLDGVSLMNSLSGKTTDAPRESVLLNTNPKKSAIRWGKWKLIVNHRADGRETSELYDLSTDISESKNILVDHPEQAKRLRQLLKNYAEEAATPLKNGR